jgi:hypothetical protein
MNPSMKKWAVPLVCVVVLVIIVVWHLWPRQINPLVPKGSVAAGTTAQDVGNFDQFQQDLASRVLKEYGAGSAGSDFSVIVATTAYPLGTLLRPTGSVPADLEDCVPAPLPKPYSAQHLFPSYTMSSDTALTANLGSHAFQGLDSAGVNLKQTSKVHYTIEDTQIQIMDDKSVDKVTGQGDCGKYISSHPGMRLIRGTVFGKMTFVVNVDNPASVTAQLAKIGGFSVSDNPQSSTLSITDNESQPIVELLSEFSTESTDAKSHPTPKAFETTNSVARDPASADVVARMFVQQDAQDTSDAGKRVVQILHQGWPSGKVESRIDRIPTEKMPDTAQVRYFNGSDVDLANRCLEILKKVYPTARVVRIGLASPRGQLEVWLPRVKSTRP